MNIKPSFRSVNLPLVAVSFVVLLGVASAILSSGCKSTDTSFIARDTNGIFRVAGNVIDPIVVGKDVQTAAQYGTKQAVQADPNARPYFQSGIAVIEATINSGNYDPNVLSNALANISIKEVRKPVVSDAVQAGLQIYANHFGNTVQAKMTNASPYLLPALTGLDNGIRAGLGMPPMPVSTVVTNPAVLNLLAVPN